MIRATTPLHRYTFPANFNMDSIKEMIITYMQDGNTIIEKRLADVSIEENVVSVKLTQEETNLFKVQPHVLIQVRVLTNAGDAMASEIKQVPVHRILNDEVME